MKDVITQLEMVRANIANCERLEQSAKSDIKRNIFRRMVAHYKVLAAELDRGLAEMQVKEAGG